MKLANLFSAGRKPPVCPVAPREPEPFARMSYAAGLVARLMNRAADTGGFRGAIPAHPHITPICTGLGHDEGERPEIALTAIATTDRASVTLGDLDPMLMAFLVIAPIHKQAFGCEPDWQFDTADAPIAARLNIVGKTFDVTCTAAPDGSATVTMAVIA